jgi:hypothetical protein
MTHISYTMTFDDGELHTLQEALSHLAALCEREIANGASVPYWSHKLAIRGIDAKILDAIRLGIRRHKRWCLSLDRERARARKSHANRALPRVRSTKKTRSRKRKAK